MGILNLVGKFAVEAGKAYVSERGVQGTIEDVSGLVSKTTEVTKNFFGSESAQEISNGEDCYEFDQDRWDAVINEINSCVDREEYFEAINKLDRYYKRYENGFDYFYYEIKARIYMYWIDSIKFDDPNNAFDRLLNKAQGALGSAKQAADQQEQYDAIRELRECISDIKDEHNRCKCRNAIFDEIDACLNREEYSEAINKFDCYYKKYENSFDYNYYDMKARIYIDWMDSIKSDDPDNAFDRLLNKAQGAIGSAKQAADQQEQYDTISELKERIRDIKEAHKLSVNHDTIADEGDENKDMAQTTTVGNSSDAEMEYMEEIKACLADDGTITDRERRLLDRLRKSLGISVERAAQLEEACNPKSLSEEEQEYADEVKACFADDGDISDKERRLLGRLAKSLGITEKRAMEIESMIRS